MMGIPKAMAILLLAGATECLGQDPHFSQFFMAPHFVNPANVGTQYGSWTMMGNFRQQWGNAGTLFQTQTLAAEAKLTGLEDDMNTLAFGMSFMNDQSMMGSFRSNYASATVAYHIQLADNHRLGAGFQGSYCNRRIDFSNLSFGQQFTGDGFDLAIPTGETSIRDLAPFFSMGAGVMYTYSTHDLSVDAGIALYDINRPVQSFLDRNNRLEPRYAYKLNMEYFTRGSVLINLHNIYHRQTTQNYFAVGGSLGLAVSPGTWDRIIYAGGWFREGDSFFPYAGVQINDIRIGISYDITYSEQNRGPGNPRSLEMSVMYSKARRNKSIPGCRIPSRFLQRNTILR